MENKNTSSLLQEILECLQDEEHIKFFASVHGIAGDPDVERRLEQVRNSGENSIKRPRCYSGNLNQTGKGGGESEKPYFVWKKEVKTFKKTLAKDTSYKVKFNENWYGERLLDIYQNLHEMFDDVLHQARGHDADLGRVVLHHPDLINPIVVPLQSWENLNADTVLSEVTKVLNSNENIKVNEGLLVTIGSIEMPKGGSKLPITSLVGPKNSLERKKSTFYIENDNNSCLAIAIGLCFLKICEKVDSKTWDELTKNDTESTFDKIVKHRTVKKKFYENILMKTRKKSQTELAMYLCKKCGVSTDRYLGLNDIPPFEKFLNINILVISSRIGDKFIRVVDENEKPNIYLYHVEIGEEKHWHGIAKIQGFFKANFCTQCLKTYKHQYKHTCETTCNVCLRKNCRDRGARGYLSCRSCGRMCRSLECFEKHKIEKKVRGKLIPSQCNSVYQCRICRKVIKYCERSPEQHRCGEWKCSNCTQFQVGQHLCYQRKLNVDITKRNKKFIFYDFETRQDEALQCKSGYRPSPVRCKNCVGKETQCIECCLCKNCMEPSCGMKQHRVNLAVLQKSCNVCEKNQLTPDSKCDNCGTRCRICEKKDKNEYVSPPCTESCGFREVIFEGDDAALKFCSYITQEHNKNSILVAHNAKSFDLYPILEVLIDRHSIRPDKIIYNGSKIMYMYIGRKLNLTFLDSLNFLPMKLAKIPSAFGLEELCKGYFPHLFNKVENQTFVGKYPDPQYYGPDYMSNDDREDFLKWYETKKNETFNFKKEIREYCKSDVDILRRGCLAFRNLVIEATSIKKENRQRDGTIKISSTLGVDPFDHATIASVCMAIYKSLFLKEELEIEIKGSNLDSLSSWHTIKLDEQNLEFINMNGDNLYINDLLNDPNVLVGETRFAKSQIAVVPSTGYSSNDNYSKISIQWLEWIMEQKRRQGTPVFIQHALNGGEILIPNTKYRCDGFSDENGKRTVYEFYGCLFHGCPSCYPNDRTTTKHSLTSQSMEELYTVTKKRERELKRLGYKLVTIWEHEFLKQLTTLEPLQLYVSSLDIQERLNPRDSFFGGRTNAVKLHYKAKDNEQIHYYDFTSLYPWTNKYCKYPIGHPMIITENFGPLDNYFGLAKVKVLPPKGLYHPVLPYTSNGKLKFPLCRKCADDENQNICNCSINERCLIGTWCTPELEVAISMGYRVLKIYEIYHFEEATQYDTKSGEGGLFSEYVNMFLKLKQEASGFPPECETEEQKQEYICHYKENEGILLEYDKIHKNPGLRCLAKLCLNSFWGKFGQRLLMRQSNFIHESETQKFFTTLTDVTKVVNNFHIISKDTIQLEWTDHPLFPAADYRTNIFLASFTTMWARLKLYSVLDILGEDVLYFDTDSIVFKVSLPSDILLKLPIGNYLGELTNEISMEDEFIKEFVSGGPKNYAYRTKSGKEECKVRGFTLNWKNSKLINFEAIRNMITTPNKSVVTVSNPNKICRDSRKRKLYNQVEDKKYQIVYTKRRILSNLDTVPYGY